jgi:DnaJ like chaperone protein
VYIFGKLTGALVGTLFGPWGILLGLVLGHLADMASERERRQGTFGSETGELVGRIFTLWGRIAAFGGGFNQTQALFLQSILANQLPLRGGDARQALAAFEESLRSSQGLPWTQALTETTDMAQEIYDDFFLDRRTLVWIYATGRRLAAFGTVRPGLVELLDSVARAFSIFEEVGTAGVEGSPRGDEGGYDQTWQNFRPASTVGPEAYATLGLDPEATVDEIKKAYRALVRQYHPDSHSGLADTDPLKKKAAERFLQVQQAYERIRQARKF